MWDVEFLIGDLHTILVEDIANDSDPYRFGLRTPGAFHVFSSREKAAWMQLVDDAVSRLNRPVVLPLSEPQSEIQEITKEVLIAQILAWAKSDDGEAVLMEVKDLAQALHPGDDFDDL